MLLHEFAKSKGAELLPPISEERVASFEARTGYRIPEGLKEFYLSCGGTDEFSEVIWKIWPFDEIEPVEIHPKYDVSIEHLKGHEILPNLTDYLIFADALIALPLYAICAKPENRSYGEIIAVSGDSDPYICGPIKNFHTFVEILQHHWELGLLPDAVEK